MVRSMQITGRQSRLLVHSHVAVGPVSRTQSPLEMVTALRSVASLRQGSWPWPLVRALPRLAGRSQSVAATRCGNAPASGRGRRAAAAVLAGGADFKKVWEAMLAFRNDEYLWWQVAELTYDTYLVHNRTRT